MMEHVAASAATAVVAAHALVPANPIGVHGFWPLRACRYEKYNEKHGAKLSSSMEEEAAEEEDW